MLPRCIRWPEPVRATRRAARDDPDPQIHAKETILHLLRLLFSPYRLPDTTLALRFAYSYQLPGTTGMRYAMPPVRR